jgi:hypothetical protein
VRRRTRLTCFCVLVVAAGSSFARSAAAGEPDPQTVEEAKRLYSEGHDAFVAGRCPDAIPLLLKSSTLVPSPNPGLLVARCLAYEGKSVAAANLYGDVERDALNLVRAGETRYAETAAAAAKEGAAVRTRLGTLHVRLRPRVGVALEIDGAPTEIQAEGDTTVLHEPGKAKVVFVLPETRAERTVPIVAGKESVVAYEPDEPKPAPVPGKQRPIWPAYLTGGVAVAGFGTFIGFGVASGSIYNDLKNRCGSSCTEADRSDANRGKAFQTVANVGVVVGIVFALATGYLVLTR